jgi:CheY-like chemotaxis protein
MAKSTTTVMVVEDETLLLEAIVKKLEHEGIKALPCSNGEMALDHVNKLDTIPDAIWLDYYLKDMNGLAFMQAIKTNPKWARVPVIVVSNSASPDKVHNMLALGVNKYILKAQYRLDEIITILREIIDDAQSGKSK